MRPLSCRRVLRESIQRASITIRTLGELSAHLPDGQRLLWEGSRAGPRKLANAFGLLLTHRDQQVSHDDIRIVSGSISERTNYMSSALRAMFQRWGIAAALEKTRNGLRLHTHDSWQTDTDQLSATYGCAIQHRDQGDQEQALELLQEAAEICNGAYLPDYKPPAEFDVTEQRQTWVAFQKQVFYDLAGLAIAMPAFPGRLSIADHSVDRLLKLGDSNAEDYLLAAEIARMMNRPRMASHYEQKARRLLYALAVATNQEPVVR